MKKTTLEIAQAICKGNPALVEYINSNRETYKPVRTQVNNIARGLADKYNNGAVIKADVLHRLTWDIINVAKDDVSEIAINKF